MSRVLDRLRGFPKIPGRLVNRVANFQEQLDVLRCRIDVDPALDDSFGEDRASDAYQAVFEEREPLVSVCIGTYNRAKLLTERTLPSILSQDYSRLEVVVVGDACTDDTEARIRAVGDPRVRFENLAERGRYPKDWQLRWMVAGTFPFNRALGLSKGSFITHLDDDDEYVQGRISTLLEFAQKTKADLVWHPFWFETAPGKWKLNPAETFRITRVTTSSVFYHRGSHASGGTRRRTGCANPATGTASASSAISGRAWSDTPSRSSATSAKAASAPPDTTGPCHPDLSGTGGHPSADRRSIRESQPAEGTPPDPGVPTGSLASERSRCQIAVRRCLLRRGAWLGGWRGGCSSGVFGRSARAMLTRGVCTRSSSG